MEYYSGKHHFKRIGEIISNQTNDVCICEEKDGQNKVYRLLWIIKDRMLARTLLQVFHDGDEAPVYLESFSFRENTVFVFPYSEERSVFRFLGGELLTQKEQEKVWRNLTETCMVSDIPYAILYQILRQRRIQIGPQGEIRFSYALDLRKFEAERGEADCANACAEIILELMEMSKSGDTRLKNALKNKGTEEGYGSFVELFQDIKENAKSFQKRKGERVRKLAGQFIKGHRQVTVKVFIGVCLILLVIALVLVGSQLKYGEIPLLRLFQNSFRMIGTENLVQ